MQQNRPPATGLEKVEIHNLCALIHERASFEERMLRPYVPTADDLDDRAQYVVDGTLLPCWSWAGHQELYSGMHKTTGLTVDR